jgi:Gti1/Pac2 family transcription factor
VSQHLISYYRVADVENGRLRSPSSLPELATLEISPEYLDKTHFRQPPRVEIGPDGVPRYRGEADETQLTALSNPGSRSHRFKPYADEKAPKKARKSRGQRANSQSENEASNYSADNYPYPTYPGYPYPTGNYPYIQYPGHSASEGGSGEVTNYNPYVAGYLWPGYNTSGAAVAEANDDDDDGEEKGTGEEISGSVAAV